jgi:Trk K+ transport system NAD-binding subunit
VVGISLELDLLAATWEVAVALFLIRLLGISVGSFLGSAVAGNPRRQSAIMGMTFVTQAGVSVGLAKEVADEFPAWGSEFATLAIAVIVMSQVIGPPFLKWALHLVGEAHPRHETPGFDGVRDAIIFGFDDQSYNLAHELTAHQWQVKLVHREADCPQRVAGSGIAAHSVSELTPAVLRALDAEKAEAIVAMLDDETNYKICELAYEHVGTASIVVRLQDRTNRERFRALGVLIVEPRTAIVSLLDHFVRSPFAASLLLGQEDNQRVIEVLVGNPDLHSVALRDLRIPASTLILSVRRRGQPLLPHGYTRLELGDEVTVVGTPESLEEVQWLFES